MNKLVLAVVVAAVVVIGGVLAYFLVLRSQGGSSQGGPGIAYFCAGFSPGPIQAIQLAERGVFQSSITYQGQTLCMGVKLTQQQAQYLKNLVSSSFVVGSSDAKVIVLEYLDPTCPYCSLFEAQYGQALRQYVQNGTVLYAVRYFPTHVLGFLQGGPQQDFVAGVETWLGLTCIYNKTGASQFYNALSSIYDMAAAYIVQYLQTGNSTLLNLYPLAQISYIQSQYPQCYVNASPQQLVALVQNADNAVSADANVLGIPNNMLGTPLFVIYRG